MSEQNRFEDVNEYLPSWNPRTKGSKKEGNKVVLEPTDESWFIGHYISSRKQVIDKDEYTIHKVKILECGNPDHLSQPIPEGGGLYEFFGTYVINATLGEKITPGECVRVQWLGKKMPEKEGGRPYQNWLTQRDTQTEPLIVKNGTIVSGPESSHHEIENVNAAGPVTGEKTSPVSSNANFDDEDDDLPF